MIVMFSEDDVGADQFSGITVRPFLETTRSVAPELFDRGASCHKHDPTVRKGIGGRSVDGLAADNCIYPSRKVALAFIALMQRSGFERFSHRYDPRYLDILGNLIGI